VAARDTVYVRFEFSAPAARAVNVAGDFNGWKPDVTQLSRGTGGVWVATIPIVVGVHKYQFVVDGDTWVPDPAAGTTDDGFGGRNSLIVVGPKGVVRS
jgi:1,4-alpha-glucan branching enzyme